MEIISTGKLRKAQAMASDERVQTVQMFNDIHGVGPSTAAEWYNKGNSSFSRLMRRIFLGYRTLDDIRKNVKLNHQQEIGMRYYDEFKQRIPRDEATLISAKVGHIP